MDMHAAEVQWRERDLRRCGLRSTFRGNDAPTFWCPVARYPIEPRAEGRGGVVGTVNGHRYIPSRSSYRT